MDRHRRLLLLRHAQAVDFIPGRGDADRPLTEAGRRQAQNVGAFLAEQGIRVDRLLCSTALRTRETAELLGLSTPVELVDELYNAGSETIWGHIAESGADQPVVLVVGHAPGIPYLAQDLADGPASEPTALADVSRGFPTATLAVLELSGEWANPSEVRLVEVRHG